MPRPVRLSADSPRNLQDPLRINTGPTAWMDQGMCVGRDPEWWTTADDGRRPKPSNERWDHLGETSRNNIRALRLCEQCPVRRECLDHALRFRLSHGIFGGLYPDQREGMARESA